MRTDKNTNLARNWNGSVAIKITAVTVWIILTLSFSITLPFISTFESSTEKEYSWESFQLSKKLGTMIDTNADYEAIKMATTEFVNNNSIQYIQFKLDDINYTAGFSSSENHKVTSQLISIYGNIETKLEFPSLSRSAKLLQVKFGSAIVGFSVLFSIFLFWLNKRIIHQPFEEIITFIQRISKGENELRLNNNRSDEFGLVSKFLDEMLDIINTNQIELKCANKDLIEEIKNREEALAANQQKSAFLANMSHEIRTPLSSIIGYTERVRFNKAKDIKEQEKMLDIVLHNGNHLLHIINDILDLSKVEANKLTIENKSISIIKITEHIRRLLNEKTLSKNILLNINYELPLPDKIHSDPTRIKQVILNLASNAIRFTEQGKVDINISYEPLNDMLSIEVKDTGIGMTQEQQLNLFKPFSQADTSISRRFGGTGLGLTISKRLAELMGGDISAQSIKDIGSQFTCKIRANFNPNKDTLITTLSPKDLQIAELEKPVSDIQIHGRILLVEDTIEIQELVKAYLEDYGIEIDTANNGAEGVEAALNGQYDLVLMDIQMPVMNGSEAIKELRLNAYNKPVLALTADALTEHKKEHLEIGFNDTLSKPININDLINTIRKHLDQSVATKNTANKQNQLSASAAQNNQHHKIFHDDTQHDDVLRDLKEKYLLQLPIYVNELKQSLEKDNLQQAYAVLHQLKGISGSLGYQELTDIAAETSELLHSGKHELAASKIKLIENFFIN